MKSRRKSVKSIWLSSLLLIDAEYLLSKEHCVKIVWKRSYFWSVFSYIWTEYGDSRSNLRIQSEYRKIRTRNNSVFGHFSRSGSLLLNETASSKLQQQLIVNLLMAASDNYHFTKITHENVPEKFWCFLQLKLKVFLYDKRV